MVGKSLEIRILMLHLVRPQTEMGNESRKKEGEPCDRSSETWPCSVPHGMQDLETVKLEPQREFIGNVLAV